MLLVQIDVLPASLDILLLSGTTATLSVTPCSLLADVFNSVVASSLLRRRRTYQKIISILNQGPAPPNHLSVLG